jgi:hypothetical protein
VGHPVGLVEHSGLRTPDELIAYVGLAQPRRTAAVTLDVIAGWGVRGESLFAWSISPYLTLPLLALILLPLAALVSALFRLDGPRRNRRRALLRTLGGSRVHAVAADAGALLPWVGVGWAVAFVSYPATTHAFAELALDYRVAFPSDLRVPTLAWAGFGLLLVVVVLGASFVDNDPEEVSAALAGTRPYRVRARLGASAGLLMAGGLAAATVVRSGPASELRTTVPVLVAGAFVITGALIGLPPVVIVVSRRLGTRSVAGDLARARLIDSRAGWRAPAVSLMLLGTIAGTGLGVLAVLDAAKATDSIVWEPQRFPRSLAVVSATANAARALTESGRHEFFPIVAVPDAAYVADGKRREGVPALYVPCQLLARLIAIPKQARDPCRSAWVLDDTLPLNQNGRVMRGRQVLTRGIRPTTAIAPAELFHGTESLLVPARRPVIDAQLHRQTASVTGVIRIRSNADLEQLRNRLWQDPATAFSGASGPLSNVVSRADLVADGHEYVTTYTRVVIGALVTASLLAMFAVSCSAALEVAESAQRDAVLTALGAPTSTLRHTLVLSTTTPAVVAALAGWAIGLGLGITYLALGSYDQLSGATQGFPLDRYGVFGLGELLVVSVLTVAGAVAVRHRAGRAELLRP